ncbi:MAG: hypothetical protein AAB561_00415 [Patescibacteria group bacterium]
MSNRKLTVIVLIVLLMGNIFFANKYFAVKKESASVLQTHDVDEKTLEFAKLFISGVLKADKEVDFETRLKLENMVRNLGDKEILAQWQKFVESKTELEAQSNVKDLLEVVVSKIGVK